ncbi:DNA topology modulation protein [Virgibacillus doumboii]|uniref:DNA topology modulation protein n=1 Tax=Virgibacillus doumboii TaxID=2697503 RepID=UPI0013DFA1D4|nr:DNA topology modulation protein [Virgibacillus doumboii]
MKKIAIIGSGGSGKSTFARQLGERLQIKVHHLDALFWKPGWIGVPKQEQKQMQHDLVKRDKWIIDGNYGGTMDIRLNAADTIILLDLPRLVCVYRIIKRFVQYRNKSRPDMGTGCEERISLEFLKWVWQYPKAKKPEIMQKLENFPAEKDVIILKSPHKINQFLQKNQHPAYRVHT